MPQPDLAFLRPRGADVLLEVAHFSLAKDREVRLPLYALAGIPEVWPFREEGAMGVYREPGEETAPLALGAPPFRWESPTGTPPA
ncbi:hypothetical protein [Thermus sp.]|uniref:hypothetical protein n=1 Tax=Thermus sp. TaxID=275 RepID=UPI00307D82CF